MLIWSEIQSENLCNVDLIANLTGVFFYSDLMEYINITDSVQDLELFLLLQEAQWTAKAF